MRAFDKAIFKILWRKPAKDAAPEIENDPEAEDGGPGSGNWGHKGRPGLVGGSGKGGGNQYRGGRADMGNFYGSKEDWLNGLNGERQREVTNRLKTAGKGDIKAGEKAIMQSGTTREKLELVKAMTEARKWDEHSERLFDNLEDDEKERLDRLLNKLQGDTVEEQLNDAENLSVRDQKVLIDLMSKAMGGETSGESIPEASDLAMNMLEDRKGLSKRNQIRAIANLQAIVDDDPNNYDVTADQLDEMMAKLPSMAFSTPEKADKTRQFLTDLGWVMDYQDMLVAGEDNELCKQNLDMIMQKYPDADLSDKMTFLGSELGLIDSLSPREQQEYLSRKFQIMGGQPLTITAKEPTTPAEAVKALRSLPSLSTPGQIATALKDSGAFKKHATIEMTGVSPKIAQKVSESYAKIIDKYPFMYGNMGGIKTGVLSSNTYANCVMGSIRRFYDGRQFTYDGTVTMNQSFYGDPEKLEKDYQEDVKTGFHMPGTGADAIITHELGHAMDGYLTEKLGFKVSQRLRGKVARRLKMKVGDVSDGVSKYAGKNEKEFFAECIAELLHSSEPRETARIFGEELESLLREGGLA